MINGGSEERFWKDVTYMYSSLVEDHKFKEDNIYLLNFDGLNPDKENPNGMIDYVARPIGGVNTKAVLLDILSNFLILGSTSAVFWGGQHRFMGNPQTYPFLGGDKGIQQWYSGKPLEWGSTTIKSFLGD